MSNKEKSGYQEGSHTADWVLEVWATSMSDLFRQALLGMYNLSGIKVGDGKDYIKNFDIQAADQEELLVEFLSEMLYILEEDKIVFDDILLIIDGTNLNALLKGREFVSIEKEIKAVTYHNLVINQIENDFSVNIVFDV